jgi:DNA polymerase-3 subunit gamma/tau
MSSYLVIARKWRPALFEEIVGQEHVTRTLTNAVSSGRIAHAYLFSGPRGVGKTTAARILAKALNCEAGPTPTPCGECASCASVAAGSSVDVFEIDGASNTGVDNVRELRESVRYVPTSGRYKVYIIDEVHMLSIAAFNALLKTLEEPPPHAVFIFATTEVHKIPLTILSRCQRFDFKRIPLTEIHRRLAEIVRAEGIEFEDGALATIAREADGSLRDAQSLLDQVLAFAGQNLAEEDVASALGLMDRTVLVDLVSAVASGRPGDCLNGVEKIYNFGYDLKRACSDLLEYIRDLTVIKVAGVGAVSDLSDGELARLAGIADAVDAEKLHAFFSLFSAAYGEISRSAFPRYAFEMAVLKAAYMEDLRPVGELIGTLEALKESLAKASPGRPGTGRAGPYGTRGQAAPQPEANEAPAGYRTGASVEKAGAPGSRPANAEAPAQASEKPVDAGREGQGGGERMKGAGNGAALKKATAPETAPPGDIKDPDAAGFVRFLSAKNALLAKNLPSVDVTLVGDRLAIVGGKDSCTVLNFKKGLMEELSAEFFARPVKIEFRTSDPVRSAGGAEGGGGNAPGSAAGGVDPLIKEAVKLFDGRIIDDRRRQNV